MLKIILIILFFVLLAFAPIHLGFYDEEKDTCYFVTMPLWGVIVLKIFYKTDSVFLLTTKDYYDLLEMALEDENN